MKLYVIYEMGVKNQEIIDRPIIHRPFLDKCEADKEMLSIRKKYSLKLYAREFDLKYKKVHGEMVLEESKTCH